MRRTGRTGNGCSFRRSLSSIRRPPRKFRHFCFEVLDRREMLTVTAGFSAGTLTVNSDAAADPIAISWYGNNVKVNGADVGEFLLASAVTAIVVNAGDGNDTIDLTNLLPSGFPNLNDITLNGGGGDDTIYGSPLGDVINGGTGDDTLLGNAGNDVLDGGAGNDRYLFSGYIIWPSDGPPQYGTADLGSDTIASDASGQDTLDFSQLDLGCGVYANLNPGSFTAYDIYGFSLAITVSSSATIEDLIGTSSDDYLVGNASNNRIDGGGAGDDQLVGGLGNDTYVCPTGYIYEYANEGVDTLDYSTCSDSLIVNLSTSSSSYAFGNLSFAGATLENIIGGSGDDILIGNSSANMIDGRSGDDHIEGSTGDDVLVGGAGDDIIFGDDNCSCGSGADYLYGGAGDDWLSGGGGNNLLDGGTGIDYVDTEIGINSIRDLPEFWFFDAQTQGGSYVFSGQIRDDGLLAGCIVVFGNGLEGWSAEVDIDGFFSLTVGTENILSDLVTAWIEDPEDLNSEVKDYWMV
jgi:Ca2+-binding RTX toxin-like protein